LWPQLPQMLLNVGLELQADQPLMVCSPAQLRPRVSPEVRIQELAADEDDHTLMTFARTAADGFAEIAPSQPLEELRHRLRVELQSGLRRAAIGWIGDRPAGVASLSPMGATAELVGVTTLPAYRRRGIATAICSHLVASHFARGGQVAWLSAEGS